MTKPIKKYIVYITIGLVLLLILFFFIRNIFFGQAQQEEMAFSNPPEEGGMVYETFTLYQQDPITIDATAQLLTDDTYFYNPEMGDIETIRVHDGQTVNKGDLLFTYYQGGDIEDEIEDALREQTRLYDQRIQLIDQMSQATGLVYNYQGDVLAGYWADDGNYYYYVAENIGKGDTIITENPDASDGEPEAGTDTSNGLEDQVRELNQQIEDVEIKLIRLKEKQRGEITANYAGTVVLDEAGKDNASIPLIRIISDQVEVTGSVSEYEFYTLEQDRPVELYINAEDRTVSGTIVDYDRLPPVTNAPASTEGGNTASIAPNMDGGATGTQYGFTISPDDYIQPGFSVKVQLALPGMVIPNEALVTEADKNYVFLLQDGRAVKTEITLEHQGLQQVVHRGLNFGDQLIMYPFDLVDGQEVQTMDSFMMSPEGFPIEGEDI